MSGEAFFFKYWDHEGEWDAIAQQIHARCLTCGEDFSPHVSGDEYRRVAAKVVVNLPEICRLIAYAEAGDSAKDEVAKEVYDKLRDIFYEEWPD